MFEDFKVRCSAISMAMSESKSNPTLTEKQAFKLAELEKKDFLTENQKLELVELTVRKDNAKKIILSATCIYYLMDEYSWITTKKVRVNREFGMPQMEKGTIVEPESVNLLSLVDQVDYIHNSEKERVYNDYLSGEIDVYLGERIMRANKIVDMKNVWDYPTFLCKVHEPILSSNRQQVQGYMDITGASEGMIADCLINTPQHIIDGFKYRLLTKMNVVTEDAPEFKEKWSVFERSLLFNDIPAHKRVSKKTVEPMTAHEQMALYDRVKVCRDWLDNFHEQYDQFNM